MAGVEPFGRDHNLPTRKRVARLAKAAIAPLQ
jgi:hypothetical protein